MQTSLASATGVSPWVSTLSMIFVGCKPLFLQEGKWATKIFLYATVQGTVRTVSVGEDREQLPSHGRCNACALGHGRDGMPVPQGDSAAAPEAGSA